MHCEVCVVRIDVGEHLTATDVIVPIPTLAEPDFVVSWVEVAVILAVPVDDGVKTPEEVIVPLVADHETELL